MFKVARGNSLIQYIIVIAIIALLVLPALITFGQSINSSFGGYLESVDSANNQIEQNVRISNYFDPKNTKAGDLGGTPEKPVVHCIDSKCTVDFGTYVINNLPKDYKEFVETSGYSEGTRLIASMLDEIAVQASNIDTIEDSDLFFQLAQQGHLIADLEEELEVGANDILNGSESGVKSVFVVPSNMLSNGNARTSFDKLLKEINDNFDGDLEPEVERLVVLLNDLSSEITNIADEMSQYGEDVVGNNYTDDSLNSILKPNASVITDLNSEIIKEL